MFSAASLTMVPQVMDQILKVLSVCESQNSDTDQLEYQPRQAAPQNSKIQIQYLK